MNILPFSIGVLSWKGDDSLYNSLLSYQNNGLSNLTKSKFVCLPEYSQNSVDIANKFSYKPLLYKNNLGILGGFKELALNMPSGPALLLENDLPLIEGPEATFFQLKKSISLLSNPSIVQIRLRSRLFPGEPFVGIDKYKKFWSKSWKSKVYRTLRPIKAKKLIGTAPYVIQNPENIHKNYINNLSNGFYSVPTSVLNWANLAIMVDRDFFLINIIKKAESMKSKKSINGFKNIEIELNNYWWRKQSWKLILAPGIFTHKRLSYRGY